MIKSKLFSLYSFLIFVCFIVVLKYSMKLSFDGVEEILYFFYFFTSWVLLVVLFWKDYLTSRFFMLFAFLLSLYLMAYGKLFDDKVDFSMMSGTLFFFVFLCSLLCVMVQIKIGKLFALVIIAFVILLFSSLVIFYNVNGYITQDTINAVLQSNPSEATDFLIDYVPLKYVGLACAIIFILCSYTLITLFSQHNKSKEVALQNRKYLIVIAFFSLSLFINHIDKGSFKLIGNIQVWVNEYYEDIRKRKEILAWKKVNDSRAVSQVDASTGAKGQLHVVVIGESLARYNMSAYGYPIQTTPWIQSSERIQLNQTYSNHTHTVPVLSLALTKANQYNNKKYYISNSVIDVAKTAGYNVGWISTQVKFGDWDNMVSVIADESNYTEFLNEENVGKVTEVTHSDGEIIPRLQKYLSTIDKTKNNLIFIHTMGSHSTYCKRIKGENISIKNYDMRIFNEKSDRCYDYTVKYTDSFLHDVYDEVSSYPSFTSMTFFSDHGDDAFDRLGHNSAKFTEYMSQIPFLFWHSDKLNSNIVNGLEKNKDKIFTNDLVFDFLLSVLDIKTSLYDEQYDITSSNYKLEEPLTLHGRKKIKELPVVLTRNNIKKNHNLVAYRINTVGSMLDAQRQGFKNIEVEVFYDKERKEIFVGSGESQSTKMLFRDFLSYENNTFKRIWVDFKKLNNENLKIVASKMSELDKQFNLKNRVLFESDFTGKNFKLFSEAGWFTSYYMPNKLIDYKQIENKFTDTLINQLSEQKVKSISFDHRVFHYIKKYLLTNAKFKKLNVELNTWTGLKASDKNFIDKLNSIEPIKSDKLKSVIVKSITRFEK